MGLVKEYCCCAIPLFNAGIYTTLTEQFVVAVTAGILTLVTPPLVGASVPSWVPTVFAILCFVAAAMQLVGFLGVFKESTIIFRRYTTLHSMITTGVFAFSAVFIGISGSKHDTAAAQCVKNFFPADPSTTQTALTGSDTEGKLVCNIFTWVAFGTMAGLWAVLALLHSYLFFVISGYGQNQRADHSRYYSLYSINDSDLGGTHPTFLPADHIGMKNLGPSADAWDTRDSMETVGFEKQQAYKQDAGMYPPPQQQASGGMPYQQGPPAENTMYPGAGHTLPPGQNYQYEDPYYQNTGRPEQSVRYPGQ